MDNVLKIDRGYAVIFVHTFDEKYVTENLPQLRNQLKNEAAEVYLKQIEEHILHDYYNIPGHIQWNYYWIIKCTSNTINEDTVTFVKDIKFDEHYCRKYFVDDSKFDGYIIEKFPEVTDFIGTVTIIETTDRMMGNHYPATQKAFDLYENHPKGTLCYPMGLDLDDLSLLNMLDLMRISVLSGVSVIYATYRSHEAFLFDRKFSFLSEKFKKIKI